MGLHNTEVQKYDCTVPVEQVETNLHKLDGDDFVLFLISCQFFYHFIFYAILKLKVNSHWQRKLRKKLKKKLTTSVRKWFRKSQQGTDGQPHIKLLVANEKETPAILPI